VFDHLLALACVFNGFCVHFCFFTNSTGSGQGYPGATLWIFLLIAKYRSVLIRLVFFDFYKKKDLDPLMKYYNNQNIKQKSRSFIEAWMGIKFPSCRITDAFLGDIDTVPGEGMPGLKRP
jgi:hypothetical protein